MRQFSSMFLYPYYFFYHEFLNEWYRHPSRSSSYNFSGIRDLDPKTLSFASDDGIGGQHFVIILNYLYFSISNRYNPDEYLDFEDISTIMIAYLYSHYEAYYSIFFDLIIFLCIFTGNFGNFIYLSKQAIHRIPESLSRAQGEDCDHVLCLRWIIDPRPSH